MNQFICWIKRPEQKIGIGNIIQYTILFLNSNRKKFQACVKKVCWGGGVSNSPIRRSMERLNDLTIDSDRQNLFVLSIIG